MTPRIPEQLKRAASARELERLMARACASSQAVRSVDVIENLTTYLCIVTFEPGGMDASLVASLGATPYGLDCAMLVVPRAGRT